MTQACCSYDLATYHLSFSDDDEEDETAELLRELEKIKKERAEQREREVRLWLSSSYLRGLLAVQENEKAAQEQEQREYDIARGNPLLNPTDFNVKRRYVNHLDVQDCIPILITGLDGMMMLSSKIKREEQRIRVRRSSSM